MIYQILYISILSRKSQEKGHHVNLLEEKWFRCVVASPPAELCNITTPLTKIRLELISSPSASTELCV